MRLAWRSSSDYPQPFVKDSGGSTMVWRYILASGVGDFVKVLGIMKKVPSDFHPHRNTT